MKTVIEFVGGETAEFDETAEVKMTPLGVQVTADEEDDTVRVLFPWNRIEKVTQRGAEVRAIHTF
jgi:hypothetical protein